eukprot:tig00021070_g17920.t1
MSLNAKRAPKRVCFSDDLQLEHLRRAASEGSGAAACGFGASAAAPGSSRSGPRCARGGGGLGLGRAGASVTAAAADEAGASSLDLLDDALLSRIFLEAARRPGPPAAARGQAIHIAAAAGFITGPDFDYDLEEYCGLSALESLRLVSRRFRRAAEDPALWRNLSLSDKEAEPASLRRLASAPEAARRAVRRLAVACFSGYREGIWLRSEFGPDSLSTIAEAFPRLLSLSVTVTGGDFPFGGLPALQSLQSLEELELRAEGQLRDKEVTAADAVQESLVGLAHSCPLLRSLRLSGVLVTLGTLRRLACAPAAPSLRSLRLAVRGDLRSSRRDTEAAVQALASFPALARLCFGVERFNVPVSIPAPDLAPLSALPHLSELEISSPVDSFAFVPLLGALESLSVRVTPGEVDAEGLRGSPPSLRRLRVSRAAPAGGPSHGHARAQRAPRISSDEPVAGAGAGAEAEATGSAAASPSRSFCDVDAIDRTDGGGSASVPSSPKCEAASSLPFALSRLSSVEELALSLPASDLEELASGPGGPACWPSLRRLSVACAPEADPLPLAFLQRLGAHAPGLASLTACSPLPLTDPASAAAALSPLRRLPRLRLAASARFLPPGAGPAVPSLPPSSAPASPSAPALQTSSSTSALASAGLQAIAGRRRAPLSFPFPSCPAAADGDVDVDSALCGLATPPRRTRSLKLPSGTKAEALLQLQGGRLAIGTAAAAAAGGCRRPVEGDWLRALSAALPATCIACDSLDRELGARAHAHTHRPPPT